MDQQPIDNSGDMVSKLVQDIEQLLDNFHNEDKKFINDVAGTMLAHLLESQSSAEGCLHNSDPSARIAALVVILRRWAPTAHSPFSKKCEDLALNDPDLEVRTVAISALSIVYEGLNDKRIGQLLATIVLDRSTPEPLRSAAYRGLYSLRGMLDTWLMSCFSPDGTNMRQVTINRSFVRSFLKDSQDPGKRRGTEG